MDPREWNALGNTGVRLGNQSTQTPTQRALAPAGTFPQLSAAWTPVRQAETEADRYRETLRRAEALHAERMAAAAKQAENARINKFYAPFPLGSRQITNKSKAIKLYEGMLKNVQAIKELKLSNAQSIIASFITGEEKTSINEQENRIKQLLQTLRSAHQNAGTRHKRKHSKRRFRATRRKTT